MTQQEIKSAISNAVFNGAVYDEKMIKRCESALIHDDEIPALIADLVFNGGISGAEEDYFFEIYKCISKTTNQ